MGIRISPSILEIGFYKNSLDFLTKNIWKLKKPFGCSGGLEAVKRNFIHKEENDRAINANLCNFAIHLDKCIEVLPVEARRRQKHIQNMGSDHTLMI